MVTNGTQNFRYPEMVQVVLFACEPSIFQRDVYLRGIPLQYRACGRYHMLPVLVDSRVSNFSGGTSPFVF